MSHSDLISALNLLRNSRENMISRTIDQAADLFSNLFLFEKSETGLMLTFEKEKTQFINSHFLDSNDNTDYLQNSDFYSVALIRLITSLNQDSQGDNSSQTHSLIYKELNSSKIKILELLINLEEKSTHNLSQLKYVLIKDSRIFEREMQNFLNAEKGTEK